MKFKKVNFGKIFKGLGIALLLLAIVYFGGYVIFTFVRVWGVYGGIS
ncbi:MAG: hypothetical protein IJ309_02445 [Clostridia bacterium]|nr:hypothetical protein [Clostridia bacterium]